MNSGMNHSKNAVLVVRDTIDDTMLNDVYVDNLICKLQAIAPSLERVSNYWEGQRKIILQNKFVVVSLSKYGSTMLISFRVKTESEYGAPHLGYAWLDKRTPEFKTLHVNIRQGGDNMTYITTPSPLKFLENADLVIYDTVPLCVSPHVYIKNLTLAIHSLVPDLRFIHKWTRRDVRILLQSDWLTVSFTKYLNLIAVSFRVKVPSFGMSLELGSGNVVRQRLDAYMKFKSVYAKLVKLGSYRKITTLPSGETTYERLR